MHRIASAILIAAAVLALNGGMLRDAFAREMAVQPAAAAVEIVQPVQAKSAKLLSLLVVLESLRQAPVALDGHKV
ncbi:MAG: hypothetical protein ABIQ30_01755 [Devosia sp.]